MIFGASRVFTRYKVYQIQCKQSMNLEYCHYWTLFTSCRAWCKNEHCSRGRTVISISGFCSEGQTMLCKKLELCIKVPKSNFRGANLNIGATQRISLEVNELIPSPVTTSQSATNMAHWLIGKGVFTFTTISCEVGLNCTFTLP